MELKLNIIKLTIQQKLKKIWWDLFSLLGEFTKTVALLTGRENNIFINNGEISIIDFDDAKKGSAICDISILIANLFFSKTYGVDINGVNTFINEYFKDEKENIDYKRKTIKKYALKWIDYILDGNEFDTSTTESFVVKRKLIIENLWGENENRID